MFVLSYIINRWWEAVFYMFRYTDFALNLTDILRITIYNIKHSHNTKSQFQQLFFLKPIFFKTSAFK